MLVQLMFPLLARWYLADRPRFLVVYRRGAQALLAVVLPVPIVALLIADPLVLALYAPEFAPSAGPLRVLSLALVLLIVGAWQSFALLAAGKQRIALVYDAAALVVNVVLNVTLILWLGYIGAALTAVATAAFVCICATIATRRVLGISLDAFGLGKVLLANLLLGGTLLLGLAAGLPWVAATVLAGLGYPVWLLVCRVATLAEVQLVLRARAVSPAGGTHV
jgi:O-antigen/teichoic acid export membrane protein